MRLLVLRVVQSVFWNLYVVVLLELVLIKVIATSPAEDKEAKEAEQKQETRLAGLAALNISRVIYLSYVLMLRVNVHIHEYEAGRVLTRAKIALIRAT